MLAIDCYRPVLNRIYRLLLSKRFPGSYPHLIPSQTCFKSYKSPRGRAVVPTAIERWEQSGRTVWWYTRDSKWEKKKSLTARVYRKVYRPLMLEEALDALATGSDVVYLEFSTLLDDVGHRYGPNSERDHEGLPASSIGIFPIGWPKLLTARTNDLSVGVISDHGMSEVTDSVDIESTLRQKGLDQWSPLPGDLELQLWPGLAERRPRSGVFGETLTTHLPGTFHVS